MIRLLFLLYYPDCFHSFQASLSFPCSAVLDPPLFRSFPKSSPSQLVDYPFGHHSTLASAFLLLLMLFVSSAWILVTWLQHCFIILLLPWLVFCFNTVSLLLSWHRPSSVVSLHAEVLVHIFQHLLALASLGAGMSELPSRFGRQIWLGSGQGCVCWCTWFVCTKFPPGTWLPITWVTFNPVLPAGVLTRRPHWCSLHLSVWLHVPPDNLVSCLEIVAICIIHDAARNPLLRHQVYKGMWCWVFDHLKGAVPISISCLQITCVDYFEM